VKALLTAIVACVALAFAGCGDDDSTEPATETTTQAATTTEAQADTAGTAGSEEAGKTKPKVAVPKNLSPNEFAFREVEKGTGAKAEDGDEVTVQYVGVGYKSGEEFDASWDRGEPFTFQLGAGQVIAGWDQGVKGMKVGGRRELLIPADLAYGEAGSPPSIGPNETLIFVVDLLAVN
jgi:peptidylprolyl isomerase